MRTLTTIILAVVVASCETEPETSVDVAEVVIDPAAVSEVDLVHVGGSPGLTIPPIAVSVGATGTGGRLTSWQVDPGVAPAALVDGPIIAGSDHQLHVLTPRLSPKLALEMLVSASISGGGLTIRTWRVAANGTLTALAKKTYATIGVEHYALGHREILLTPVTKRYQLVVPIVHLGALRLATYEVDGISGAITVRADSGDLVFGAAGDPQLSVSFVQGNKRLRSHYAVSFVDGAGQIVNSAWAVDDLGATTLGGSYVSGKDIANVGGVVRNTTSLATAPLARSGFVTIGNAPPSQSTDPTIAEVQVWEDLFCGGSCLVPLNITDSSRDTAPGVFGVQQVAAPVLLAPRALARDPIWGFEDLFPPKSPDSVQSIASVRKVMVLIVMLEAVAGGEVDFDDIVTVSDAAANTAGSNMGLVAGERITLRDLAYGMMMVSAGDATWAISEHVAGTVDAFIVRMNAKAVELGLANTVYCHDEGSGFSSVGYSTARDQAAIWASVYDDPDFIDISGRSSLVVCGTLADDSQSCHPLAKNMSWYIELDGTKGGNGGGSCKAYANLYSTCSGCLTAQATRLDRPLVTTTLATGAFSTNSDATKLFDYSFRQIYTPDYRGNSAAQAGSATDFGLDTVTDRFALTAAPAAGSAVKVCNWNADTSAGSLFKGQCTTHGLAGLTPSPGAIPRRVGIATLGTVEAEADYVVGRITGGSLKLHLWRVGQKAF